MPFTGLSQYFKSNGKNGYTRRVRGQERVPNTSISQYNGARDAVILCSALRILISCRVRVQYRRAVDFVHGKYHRSRSVRWSSTYLPLMLQLIPHDRNVLLHDIKLLRIGVCPASALPPRWCGCVFLCAFVRVWAVAWGSCCGHCRVGVSKSSSRWGG